MNACGNPLSYFAISGEAPQDAYLLRGFNFGCLDRHQVVNWQLCHIPLSLYEK